jgi:hypothetical protein
MFGTIAPRFRSLVTTIAQAFSIPLASGHAFTIGVDMSNAPFGTGPSFLRVIRLPDSATVLLIDKDGMVTLGRPTQSSNGQGGHGKALSLLGNSSEMLSVTTFSGTGGIELVGGGGFGPLRLATTGNQQVQLLPNGAGGSLAKAGAAGAVVWTTQGITSQAGAHWTLQGQSSTTAGRNMAVVDAAWADATDASRKGRLVARACDSTGTDREGWRVESDGTQALVGFFGQSAGARPTVSGSRGGNAALQSLLTSLAGLGLIVDSTSA